MPNVNQCSAYIDECSAQVEKKFVRKSVLSVYLKKMVGRELELSAHIEIKLGDVSLSQSRFAKVPVFAAFVDFGGQQQRPEIYLHSQVNKYVQ